MNKSKSESESELEINNGRHLDEEPAAGADPAPECHFKWQPHGSRSAIASHISPPALSGKLSIKEIPLPPPAIKDYPRAKGLGRKVH